MWVAATDIGLLAPPMSHDGEPKEMPRLQLRAEKQTLSLLMNSKNFLPSPPTVLGTASQK